jgi:hypothetical protein
MYIPSGKDWDYVWSSLPGDIICIVDLGEYLIWAYHNSRSLGDVSLVQVG